MDIEFSIWIASRTRWAHLTKYISLPAIPRVGEYVKFQNQVVGDYFSWKITQVTYHESGDVKVWTELLNNINDQNFSFEEEDEFDEYFQSYIDEGWQCNRGIVQNTRFKDNKIV